MEIKTIVSYHFTHHGCNQEDKRYVGKHVEKKKSLSTLEENANEYSHYGKQYGGS
jgi:hypothetical protein